ncbi:S9 family peptidase [Alicyclobacillus acidoterrestris]|uniref:S9 family peptidase n=1 Tax=Alicyclobacillus acidoterrestris (strain ATCC 49025 / DSM 3922 / CIP 106132 / NCIMB 13137 / GD3B) TaxID=1356854 RepID=T0BWM8_ALIAG|nr:S9 family peptidase [Alicyclobacillus acidoterrestris]EPZ45239.1 hypothetical protein N007_09150 [Alicyclobacillus acidoterrestris ATCC 49025]UNO50127.1 S9 family peptidase [Alicyclobacillus acidoterrestris]
MQPPKAKRIPHPHVLHDHVRPDDYYWLRERENPEVIQYLEAENQYYDAHMRPLAPLADKIYEQMVARIPEAENDVPAVRGPYYYYKKMDKNLQYPIYVRKRATSRDELATASEEIVLDVNALARDGEYLSVTVLRISPDHRHLAYLENRDGTDKYTLCVRDIETGEMLPEKIENVFIYESVEWDRTGEFLYYLTVDESQRPYRLWRHQIGHTGQDELLYEETDITFTLSLAKSRSGRYLFLTSSTKTTSEVHFIAADAKTGSLQVVDERRAGILYEVEHWGEDFLILSNEGATNFHLWRCPTDDLAPSGRTELFSYDKSRYLQAVYPFKEALIISGREDGLTALWVYRDGSLTRLDWDEPLYTVAMGHNLSYDTTEVLIEYESYLTPRTTYLYHLDTNSKTPLQVAPVAGEFTPEAYRQERLFATAPDGVRVPMTVVYRKDAFANGPAPLILSGYGSYGITSDPHFDATRLPFLDSGIVFVTAQVRGGSEMGHDWYEDGKLLNKRNTFTDFIAVAEDLIARGYTTADKMAARGGSAGGLLVGAVANMAGHLFKVITPAVPFVDVVTTMLDASIPLTSLEWDEWGNPADKTYYDYMLSYSPYDNVEAKAYPHMLVTTGLNDPRVAYWEPAKWVARLRATKTDDNTLLLKTNMGAGHFGASGRFNHLKEAAEHYAFILDKLGVDMK